MPFYAIVFKKEFKPGEHWDLPNAQVSDLRQHWKVGDLYSTGTVVPSKIPDHFEAIEIDVPHAGQTWNSSLKKFV